MQGGKRGRCLWQGRGSDPTLFFSIYFDIFDFELKWTNYLAGLKRMNVPKKYGWRDRLVRDRRSDDPGISGAILLLRSSSCDLLLVTRGLTFRFVIFRFFDRSPCMVSVL